MAKVLIAVDGSEHSQRVIEHLLKMRAELEPLEVHLLNVQIPIESGHARMFVSREQLDEYYRDEGLAALAQARELLDQAGVPYRHHVAVGHVAQTIADYASEKGFDQILIGSHGRGALRHLLMGSVATDVLRLSKVPVTMVRQ
jgi:nucleotide-binding universal stress UspA family protein